VGEHLCLILLNIILYANAVLSGSLSSDIISDVSLSKFEWKMSSHNTNANF
jgi:hypothetical protein